jgi:hypothetical protein
VTKAVSPLFLMEILSDHLLVNPNQCTGGPRVKARAVLFARLPAMIFLPWLASTTLTKNAD